MNETKRYKKIKNLLLWGIILFLVKFCIVASLHLQYYLRNYRDLRYTGELVEASITLIASIIISIGLLLLRKEIKKDKNKILAIVLLLLSIVPVRIGVLILILVIPGLFIEPGMTLWGWQVVLTNLTTNLADVIIITIAISCLSWQLFNLKRRDIPDVKLLLSPLLLIIIIIVQIIIICLELSSTTFFDGVIYNLSHAVYGFIGIIIFVEILFKVSKIRQSIFEEINI